MKAADDGMSAPPAAKKQKALEPALVHSNAPTSAVPSSGLLVPATFPTPAVEEQRRSLDTSRRAQLDTSKRADLALNVPRQQSASTNSATLDVLPPPDPPSVSPRHLKYSHRYHPDDTKKTKRGFTGGKQRRNRLAREAVLAVER